MPQDLKLPKFYDARLLVNTVALGKPGDNPYTLLLGGGASATSGVRTAQSMVAQWQCKLWQMKHAARDPTPDELKEWLEGEYILWRQTDSHPADSDYAALFSYFFPYAADRQRYIEDEIEGKAPGFGYLYLAGLVAAGRFNRILTTNFDELIADALIRFYGIRPIVCAFDSAVSGIRLASTRPKVIKLHGDFLYDSMRNVRQEVQHLGQNMEEKLFEACKDSGLIVIGYDGNDESVMGSLHQMLRRRNHLKFGLHWCVFVKDPRKPPELTEKLRALYWDYEGQIRLYGITGFDLVMLEMFTACQCNHPEVFLYPRRKSAFMDFYRAATAIDGYIPDPRMQEHLDLYSEKAADDKMAHEMILFNAESSFRHGNAALDEGRWGDARQRFLESLRTVDSLLQEPDLSFELRAAAMKRKTGVAVGLADAEFQESCDTWKTWLRDCFNLVEEGARLIAQPEGEKLSASLKRAFFYNGCCAFGIKHLAEGGLDPSDDAKLRGYLREVRRFDVEGIDIRALKVDRQFRSLVEILDDSFEVAEGINGSRPLKEERPATDLSHIRETPAQEITPEGS